MNGVVESLINSVRKALDASVINYTHSKLTYEQWATVLSEITYLINSRPLFPEGNPDDFNCIWETTCYILIDKHLLSSHQMTRKLILRTHVERRREASSEVLGYLDESYSASVVASK